MSILRNRFNAHCERSLFRPLLPLRNLGTSFGQQQQLAFHNNNGVKTITLILPKNIITAKLTTTQYILTQGNFFCFSTWSLVDSHFDGFFDSDTIEFEDETNEDLSGALVS